MQPRQEVKNHVDRVDRRSPDVGGEFVNSGGGVAMSVSCNFSVCSD